MNKGQRIKQLRLDAQMTQDELAERIFTTKQTIHKYETGIVTNIPSDKIELLANVFNVSPVYLMAWDNDDQDLASGLFPLETKRFPLLGEISCGEPIFVNEDRESYTMAGTNIDADFCLKAKGDSMINARIFDGDIVFIKETELVNNGEIAAVIIDDEVLLKRYFYYPKENLLILQSENPKYQPKKYINEQLDHIRIVGKAIAFQSDIV